MFFFTYLHALYRKLPVRGKMFTNKLATSTKLAVVFLCCAFCSEGVVVKR